MLYKDDCQWGLNTEFKTAHSILIYAIIVVLTETLVVVRCGDSHYEGRGMGCCCSGRALPLQKFQFVSEGGL